MTGVTNSRISPVTSGALAWNGTAIYPTATFALGEAPVQADVEAAYDKRDLTLPMLVQTPWLLFAARGGRK